LGFNNPDHILLVYNHHYIIFIMNINNYLLSYYCITLLCYLLLYYFLYIIMLFLHFMNFHIIIILYIIYVIKKLNLFLICMNDEYDLYRLKIIANYIHTWDSQKFTQKFTLFLRYFEYRLYVQFFFSLFLDIFRNLDNSERRKNTECYYEVIWKMIKIHKKDCNWNYFFTYIFLSLISLYKKNRMNLCFNVYPNVYQNKLSSIHCRAFYNWSSNRFPLIGTPYIIRNMVICENA